jgi:SAM-dependent methyltransferase
MKEMWENRYSGDDYAYGTAPNEFFRQVIDTLSPGRILLPADGEGRNGIYAATRGWEVLSLDFSENGREKAIALARENNVEIQYDLADIFSYPYPDGYYDAIALIYVHVPHEKRAHLHKLLISALKPGGTIFLEGFNKNQLSYSSGGPKDINMLFSENELREDFKELDIRLLEEIVVVKDDGPFHQGESSVIRLIGQRKIDEGR